MHVMAIDSNGKLVKSIDYTSSEGITRLTKQLSVHGYRFNKLGYYENKNNTKVYIDMTDRYCFEKKYNEEEYPFNKLCGELRKL
ncbi:MAG: hypothetical protein IJ193_00185 [Bacilli bacterium]|nr:hypothetical protein [Bacilli bacterium]